jgi:hypothetical protein
VRLSEVEERIAASVKAAKRAKERERYLANGRLEYRARMLPKQLDAARRRVEMLEREAKELGLRV